MTNEEQPQRTIVWTIAGSDPSGGAGIQADLHTFNALGVHGCSVIAALTAQNSIELKKIEFCSADMLLAQLAALSTDLPPSAIKLGMVGSLTTLKTIAPFLERFPQAVIYDPVLSASVGGALHNGELRDFLLSHFLPRITVLTPNIPEAEWLLGRMISNHEDMELAAHELLRYGPRVVVLKGGHAPMQLDYCQDFWTDGTDSGWLSSVRQNTPHRHGTGCTLASAIAAILAQGYELREALVLAKAYINQAIRLGGPMGKGRGTLRHLGWPNEQEDLPLVSTKATIPSQRSSFNSCGPEPLGFYPIVANAQWVERLLLCGVKTIQLRIKECSDEVLKAEIQQSIALAQRHQARLFINDHWHYAIEYGAYGVHLGQEDINDTKCMAIRNAGLRLGISSHSYYELARAMTYKPSYIACGPIYHTHSKIIKTAPQGLARLKAYCSLLDYPIVAIGGIQLDTVSDIMQAGADSIAVISTITQAEHPEQEVARWLTAMKSDKVLT